MRRGGEFGGYVPYVEYCRLLSAPDGSVENITLNMPKGCISHSGRSFNTISKARERSEEMLSSHKVMHSILGIPLCEARHEINAVFGSYSDVLWVPVRQGRRD